MDEEVENRMFFVDYYIENIYLILDYYAVALTQSNAKKSIFKALLSPGFTIPAIILVYMFFITFFGKKFEKTSLSVFVGAFFYTLANYYIGTIEEITPKLIRFLPSGLRKSIPEAIAKNSYWIILIVVISGLLLFFLMFNFIRIAAMVLLSYFVYDYFGKHYINIQDALNYTNQFIIVVFVVFFYVALKSIFSILFSFMFALYGSLFVLGFILAAAGSKIRYELFCFDVFYDSSFKELLKTKEFLYWICLSMCGIACQNRLLF